jgi:hypothetical protein
VETEEEGERRVGRRVGHHKYVKNTMKRTHKKHSQDQM